MKSDIPSSEALLASSPVLSPAGELVAKVEKTTRRRERPPSLLAYPATYLLIGINVLVYLAMFRFGPVPALVSQHAYGTAVTAPFSEDVLQHFGSSVPSLILYQGQWWRLITSMFVHVMLLHLLLNMWCLWNLGLFGEPLLGRAGLVAVYVLTGAAGMLQSFAVSRFARQEIVTAGASGAVFGIAGILIVLLSNRKLSLPWEELRGLRRQVIFFALANLAIGIVPGALPAFSPAYLHRMHVDPEMLPHIDNSAHIGGLICGLALGLPLYPRMTSGRSSYRARQVLVFSVTALLLCLAAYALGVR